MSLTVFFYITLSMVSGYAYLRGGLTERLCASILVLGSLLSAATVILFKNNWHVAGPFVLVIDVVALFLLAAIAIRSDRF